MDLFDRITAEEERRIEAAGLSLSDAVALLTRAKNDRTGTPSYRDPTAAQAIGNVMKEQRRGR